VIKQKKKKKTGPAEAALDGKALEGVPERSVQHSPTPWAGAHQGREGLIATPGEVERLPRMHPERS
jgi:hypothetical protein